MLPRTGPHPTPRTTVQRRAGRARYDRATIEAILDAGMIGHVGIVSGGQPYVIPWTAWFWRARRFTIP